MSEKTPLLQSSLHLGETPLFKVYKIRWYILLVFSMASFLQSMVWCTFSSAVDQVKEYYNFTLDNSDLDLLLTWGPIVFIPVVVLVPYLEKTLGPKRSLRAIVLLGSGLTTAGSLFRLIPCWSESLRSDYWSYIFFLAIGQILNAASGPFVMASPSKLSVTWFPTSERTLATALFIVCNNLGTALGMFLGPRIVPEASSLPILLYSEAAASALTFILIVIYFPASPPLPPTMPSTSPSTTTTTTTTTIAIAQQNSNKYNNNNNNNNNNNGNHNSANGQNQSISTLSLTSSTVSTTTSTSLLSPNTPLSSSPTENSILLQTESSGLNRDQADDVDDDNDELMFSRTVQKTPSERSVSIGSQNLKGPIHKVSLSDLQPQSLTPTSELSFTQSLIVTFKMKSFLLLAIAGGAQAGIFNAWTGVFPTIIANGSNDFSFYGQLAGILAALLVGRLCDTYFKRKFKIIIIVLFLACVASLVWFTLSFPIGDYDAVLSADYATNAIAISIAGFLLGGTNPLFYELAAEITYPISEEMSAGVITLLNNIGCIIMLLVSAHMDPNYMNLTATAAFLACVLPILFIKEEYKRLDAQEAREKANASVN